MATGVDVHSPLLVTLPYSGTATAINAAVLLRVIRRWLARSGGDAPLIVITFLPTPLALQVIDGLAPSLSIYYCIDRLSESSPAARRIAKSEARLFAHADLVLVTSKDLYELAARHGSNVELLVSGVRCDEFDRARRLRAQRPDPLAGLRRPVIGFVGTLRDAIDLNLLRGVALLAPDLTFVLAGPQMADVRALAALPNVRLLGEISHEETIELMVRFDVGILPYSLNRFTAAVMPVKLKEYLAAGLPVVATPLPEVVAFAAQHPVTIRFATDAESFVAAIRTALADNGADAEQQRIGVAQLYDWPRQIDRLFDLIQQASSRSGANTKPMAGFG